jgi:hypothetical protein
LLSLKPKASFSFYLSFYKLKKKGEEPKNDVELSRVRKNKKKESLYTALFSKNYWHSFRIFFSQVDKAHRVDDAAVDMDVDETQFPLENMTHFRKHLDLKLPFST